MQRHSVQTVILLNVLTCCIRKDKDKADNFIFIGSTVIYWSFFIIDYQLVSERAVKRADSRFELIQKNVGYFFKDIERSALTLKDSLYLLKNTEEIQRAVILKMEMMPFLDSVGLVLDDNKYYLFSRRANDKIVVYHQEQVNGPLVDESGRVIFADFNPSKRPWSMASDDSNNSWNPAYNCFDRPGKNVSLLRYTSTAKIMIC